MKCSVVAAFECSVTAERVISAFYRRYADLFSTVPELRTALVERHNRYRNALMTRHHLHLFPLGSEYARLCNGDVELFRVLEGVGEFSATSAAIKSVLEEVVVVPDLKTDGDPLAT